MIWANESYYHATQTIYPRVKQSQQLDYNWTTLAYELCRERIALAGYRLAAMLQAVL